MGEAIHVSFYIFFKLQNAHSDFTQVDSLLCGFGNIIQPAP